MVNSAFRFFVLSCCVRGFFAENVTEQSPAMTPTIAGNSSEEDMKLVDLEETSVCEFEERTASANATLANESTLMENTIQPLLPATIPEQEEEEEMVESDAPEVAAKVEDTRPISSTGDERVLMVIEGRLKHGEGRGYCLGVTGAGTMSVRISRLAARLNTTSKILPRLRSSRDHVYCGVFALDERRDAIALPGDPAMVSSRKLRIGEELAWEGYVPEGGSLHVLVASNAVDDTVESGYSIRVSTPYGSSVSSVFDESSGDGLGWRGVGEPLEVPRYSSAPRRLMCLDGGGARGVVPLAVLSKIEKLGSKRARERFDLFAGTSTGAIIAAAIAIAELPVPVVQYLYDDIARLIFGSKGLSRFERSDRLRAVLTAVFGKDAKLRRHDSSRDDPAYRPRCMLIATDASTQRLRPRLFRNYDAGEIDEIDDDDELATKCTVVDAILASAAAPPFFPASHLYHRKLLDGALVANNPTLFAVIESAALGRDTPEVVVSLGTGISPLRAHRSSHWLHSHLDFAEGLINLVTETDATHDLVKRYLESFKHTAYGHFYRSKQRTFARYHRLDPVLDASNLKLDEGDETALRALRSMALDYLQREKTHDWAALVRELKGHPQDHDQQPLYEAEEVETRPASSDKWLRPFRKRAARITGIHGFFSNKPQRTFVEIDTPTIQAEEGPSNKMLTSSAGMVVSRASDMFHSMRRAVAPVHTPTKMPPSP